MGIKPQKGLKFFEVFEIGPIGKTGRSLGVFETKTRGQAIERAGKFTLVNKLRVFPVKIVKSKNPKSIINLFR